MCVYVIVNEIKNCLFLAGTSPFFLFLCFTESNAEGWMEHRSSSCLLQSVLPLSCPIRLAPPAWCRGCTPCRASRSQQPDDRCFASRGLRASDTSRTMRTRRCKPVGCCLRWLSFQSKCSDGE